MSDDARSFEMVPVKRGSIRARVIFSFSLMAVICIVFAFATGHSAQDVCKPIYNMLCGDNEHYVPAAIGPNIVWFLIGFWPGAAAALTAFVSWAATGRPW
jgi:hypothetical protein